MKCAGVNWLYIAAGITFIISVLIIYGFFIEPYQIEIHHVWIHDPYFGKYFGKKTVVQLSDLHIADIGKREQKILKILDDLKPDIIFLTGDYVKWKGNYEAALTFLSQLKAKVGIWGVLGDYDYSRSRISCFFCHVEGSGEFTKNHQVHFLRNSTEMVHLPQGPIWICGIEKKEGDPSSLLKSLQSLKDKKPVNYPEP